MAKPQFLQELTHDKILTKGNFPKFVETFNYTVNRCDNLKGDDDIGGTKGLINVDNTDPEHPIVRCNCDNLRQMIPTVPIPDAEVAASAYTLVGESKRSSIQISKLHEGFSDEIDIYQLYSFNNPSAVQLTSSNISNYNIVLRDINAKCVAYGNLDLSSISGGTCSCDLQPVLSSGTVCARWTKDGTNWVDVYCLSGTSSSSQVSASVTFTGTDSTTTATANTFTLATASDSNMVITCNGNTITFGCYYL